MQRVGLAVVVIATVVSAGTAWAVRPKCRALDANDGALILEVANRSATKCTALLSSAMKKKRCTRSAKGKKVEYMSQYDHAGVKGKLTTVTCGAAELPKCRAIDAKTKTTIAEVAQKSSTRCAKLLASEVKHERCTKKNHGKRIAYTTRFEQRGAKAKRVALVCK